MLDAGWVGRLDILARNGCPVCCNGEILLPSDGSKKLLVWLVGTPHTVGGVDDLGFYTSPSLLAVLPTMCITTMLLHLLDRNAYKLALPAVALGCTSQSIKMDGYFWTCSVTWDGIYDLGWLFGDVGDLLDLTDYVYTLGLGCLWMLLSPMRFGLRGNDGDTACFAYNDAMLGQMMELYGGGIHNVSSYYVWEWATMPTMDSWA